jgi:actin-like ATPase involved in cell morphogenesis
MARLSGDSFVYGVDFGMTTSSLAVMSDTGQVELVTDPAIVEGAASAVPTAVFAAGSGGGADLLIGQAAVNAKAGRPMAYRDNFKRNVGINEQLLLDDRPFRLVDLIAAVLRFLYDQAQELRAGPPAATVLTVPADWATGRRDIMKSAAIAAGYPGRTLFVIDEPTASIEYARSLGLLADHPVTLVYDLGGSTLDCAAVRPGLPGQSDPRAVAGREIGGSDFDAAILAEVRRRFPAEFAKLEDGDLGREEPWRLGQLERACETVKRRLSVADDTAEILHDLPGRPELVLSRAELEALIGETVSQTIDVAHGTLKELGLTWPEIDVVLLVGGSTHVPLIERSLETAAPGKVLVMPDRNFAPALGAAVMARREADTIAARRRPRSANLVTASPWLPRAIVGQPSVTDAAGVPEAFDRRNLPGIWAYLFLAIAGVGLLAVTRWDLAERIAAGLLSLICVALAGLFSGDPVGPNHDAAVGVASTTSVGTLALSTAGILYLLHGEPDAGLLSFSAVVCLVLCAVMAARAGGAAERARDSAAAYALHQQVIRRIGNQRWFGDTMQEPPPFLSPLFEIPALRGFRLSARPREEQRYALAAGRNVLLIAMLRSRVQRPVLSPHSLGITLPDASVRTILVAPGATPPRVSADEAFEGGTMITTEHGLVDIVGRWLEQDNQLRIPLLAALLPAADSPADRPVARPARPRPSSAR